MLPITVAIFAFVWERINIHFLRNVSHNSWKSTIQNILWNFANSKQFQPLISPFWNKFRRGRRIPREQKNLINFKRVTNIFQFLWANNSCQICICIWKIKDDEDYLLTICFLGFVEWMMNYNFTVGMNLWQGQTYSRSFTTKPIQSPFAIGNFVPVQYYEVFPFCLTPHLLSIIPDNKGDTNMSDELVLINNKIQRIIHRKL